MDVQLEDGVLQDADDPGRGGPGTKSRVEDAMTACQSLGVGMETL